MGKKKGHKHRKRDVSVTGSSSVTSVSSDYTSSSEEESFLMKQFKKKLLGVKSSKHHREDQKVLGGTSHHTPKHHREDYGHTELTVLPQRRDEAPHGAYSEIEQFEQSNYQSKINALGESEDAAGHLTSPLYADPEMKPILDVLKTRIGEKEVSFDYTKLNTDWIKNTKDLVMEPDFKNIETSDMCFVFPKKYDDDTMVPKENAIRILLKMLWKREPPTNEEEAKLVVQEKHSVKYLSSLYDISQSIDTLPPDGVPMSKICEVVRNNFFRTLSVIIPCKIKFVVAQSDNNLLIVKVRMDECVARQIADESEYLLNMDPRVSGGEYREAEDFVPPYAAFEEQFEEIPELACMQNVGMIWTRYDKLSRPVLLDEFDINSFELSVFRDVDRIRLLHRTLEMLYNFTALQDYGVLCHWYPLHQPYSQGILSHDWARLANAWQVSQPLDQIRDYFGEEIGLYFGWLGFYTKALKFLGIFGAVLFFIQMIWDPTFKFDVPWINVVTLAFSTFVIGWNTYFFHEWRRRQAVFSLRWGLETNAGLQSRNRERNNFIADRYIKDPVQPSRWVRSYNKRKHKLRAFISNSITVVLTVVTVICCNQSFHEWCIKKMNISDSTQKLWEPYVGMLAEYLSISAWVIAILVKVFDIIFCFSVQHLVRFENHQFDNDYNDSLVLKMFFFKALDYFTPMVYIAFFKRFLYPELADTDMRELRSQLMSLFLVDFAFNVVEIGTPAIPYIMAAMKSTAGRSDTAETQMEMVEYENTVQDYEEMIIQLGLVSLFSVICPIVPFLAWISNHFEIRVDALKLVKIMRRPFPVEVRSIGAWETVIQFMILLSIIMNTATGVFIVMGKHAQLSAQLTLSIVFLGSMFAVKEAVEYLWPRDTEEGVRMRARMVMVGHEAFWGKYSRKFNEMALMSKTSEDWT